MLMGFQFAGKAEGAASALAKLRDGSDVTGLTVISETMVNVDGQAPFTLLIEKLSRLSKTDKV